MKRASLTDIFNLFFFQSTNSKKIKSGDVIPTSILYTIQDSVPFLKYASRHQHTFKILHSAPTKIQYHSHFRNKDEEFDKDMMIAQFTETRETGHKFKKETTNFLLS